VTALARLGPEQRKLAASLAVNFATRVPGLAGVVVMLPLLHRDLGTQGYAFLLGAMALGATVTFLFGGFHTVGRRQIGEAHSRGDAAAEADGFVTLMAVNGAILLLAMVALGGFCATRGGGGGTMFAIAALVALAACVNGLDNARAAYNEHYVTAVLQIVFQVANIAAAFAFPPLRQDPLTASLVLSGHGLLASLVAGAMLLRRRPYLLRGRVRHAAGALRQGLAIGMADGVLAATLSFSVVWMQASAGAAVAGWYGTLIRLFQTILVPVILLLVPLSSYIRLGWNAKSAAAQARIVAASVVLGIGYGALASAGLALASWLYIDRVLALPAPGDWTRLVPIYALFTAIIAYRSYSSIAYLVMDGARLAGGIALRLLGALAVAAGASLVLSPLGTIVLYAALVGAILIEGELSSALRFRRGLAA